MFPNSDDILSFYNYIYYTVAGFSEIDTFRSNQIREGLLSREEGLKMIEDEKNESIEIILNGFTQEDKHHLLDKIKKLIKSTSAIQKNLSLSKFFPKATNENWLNRSLKSRWYMAQILAGRRDVDFVLHEQFQVRELFGQ